MGSQADDEAGPGSEPEPGESLRALLASFEEGGARGQATPSAALAAALEAAAGPDGLYGDAGAGALVGIARQWAAIESWAAAGLLGSLRSMMREDRYGDPLLRRDLGLPEGADDSLVHELAQALAMGPMSTGNLAKLAWTLGMRLPGIGSLLARGILTRPKAKLIATIFGPLDEDEATRAEALIVGELKGKTWFQVERLAWRAALAVAPDVAERRRKAGEKQARVTIFREEAGTVGLSGRDLPTAQALSGHANVLARAQEYQRSGAFPGWSPSRLEALAYLHLLNGASVEDAIAFARTADTEPPSRTAKDEEGQADEVGDDADADAEEDEAGNSAAQPPDGGPARDDRHARGDGDAGRDDEGPERDDDGPDDYDDPDDDPGDDDPDDDDPDDDDRDGGDHGGDPGPDGGGTGPGGAGGGPAVLPDVAIPLATLLRRAERAGENRLLGAFDPALARQLALAAVRSPYSRWEVTIVDERGYAIGHGRARPRRGGPQGPEPPGAVLCPWAARVNLTVTETLLRQLAAQASQRRSGAPPGEWALIPRKRWTGGERPDDYGTWTLVLPCGRELSVRFDVVPTHACDHRYEVKGYQPGDRLRRLIQIRDQECTFPPCSRAAHASDFEHAIPYHLGGKTDACNAGARSRRCHQVKQSPGWKVTQPKPGWHEWTTPTGRTYVQEPWRYIA